MTLRRVSPLHTREEGQLGGITLTRLGQLHRKVRKAGILHTMPPGNGPTGPRESLVKRREVCIFSSISGRHTPTWQVVMRNRW